MSKITLMPIIEKVLACLIHPAAVLCFLFVGMIPLYAVEGRWQQMPFVALIVAVMASCFYLLTRRIAFSAYLSLTIMMITTLMSVAKFQGKGFDLHVYDFAFTATDLDALKFITAEYANLVAPVLLVLACAIVGLALIWRKDKPRLHHFALRAAPLAVSALALPATYPVGEHEPRHFYYLSGFNASSFYVSLLDISDRLNEEPIVSRLQAIKDAQPYENFDGCGSFKKRPDIFFVLSESATNTATYPQLNIQSEPKDAFVSQDGKARTLRVETFGGGTWITNLSLMTGLPSRQFGWRSPYLTVQLEGRIHESIPSLLKRCGYRSAAVLPMSKAFVNEGPFLQSIGFDTVDGYEEIGATHFRHRDTFYYEAANSLIEDHLENDGRPLFLEVQTMFAHSPFKKQKEDHIRFQEAAYSEDPALNEYVRRVYIAQQDFHAFLEQRKRLQPDRPFVVLEFGDHQSLATLELANELAGGNSLLDPDSKAYKTHYTVHAHKFDIDTKFLNWVELDIGFLGVSFMQSIGAPLTPMFEDLARLRDTCDGRFDGCSQQEAIDLHMKRRVNSGLLSLPSS